MLTTAAQPMGDVPAADRVRRVALMYGAAVVVMILLGVVAYGIFDRAANVNRASAAAIRLTADERMLSQRIASLTAQYAFGNHAAAPRLRAAADALRDVERSLVAGDAARRLAPLDTDPALHLLYFGGRSPLDAAIRTMARGARQVAALEPGDPRLAAAAGVVFAASGSELLDMLDTAIGMREAATSRQLDLLVSLFVATAGALLVTVLTAAFAIVGPLLRASLRLADQVAQYARTATTDPLTGTLNRRGFHDRGTLEIAKAKRYNRPLSLLMIDPDQLDPIKRTHGPAVGETVLQALTEMLSEGTRTTDLVGRVGGEEFAVLLPETDLAGAELLAERLRLRISDLVVPVEHSAVSCTVSIGVAAAEKDATFLWPTFQRAGEALHEAKMRGRNRVFVNAAA